MHGREKLSIKLWYENLVYRDHLRKQRNEWDGCRVLWTEAVM